MREAFLANLRFKSHSIFSNHIITFYHIQALGLSAAPVHTEADYAHEVTDPTSKASQQVLSPAPDSALLSATSPQQASLHNPGPGQKVKQPATPSQPTINTGKVQATSSRVREPATSIKNSENPARKIKDTTQICTEVSF